MLEIVASFQYSRGNTQFHVARGEALEIPTDVAIIGRARAVRAELSRRGAVFQPLAAAMKGQFGSGIHRGVQYAEWSQGPWRHIFALDYRPGSDRMKFRTPDLESTHPSRLAHDLHWLAYGAALRLAARRFVFLPLSWRNPNVTSAATVSAAYGMTTTLAQFREPPFGWRFVLCDKADPSPFLRFLRNEKDCLARFIGQTVIAASSWYRTHPIREIAPAPDLAAALASTHPPEPTA